LLWLTGDNQSGALDLDRLARRARHTLEEEQDTVRRKEGLADLHLVAIIVDDGTVLLLLGQKQVKNLNNHQNTSIEEAA